MVKLIKLLFFLKTKDHVLWLQICVDNVAYPVEIVEPNQSLPGNLAYYGNWYAFIVILLYQ